MPFLEIDEKKYIPPSLKVGEGDTAGAVPIVDPKKRETTFLGAAKRGFFHHTTIGSFATNKVADNGVIDPDFDVSEAFKKLPMHVQADRGFMPFMRSKNQEHFDSIVDQIAMEDDNADYLRQAGFMGGVAGMGAQLLDPVNWIPIGGTAIAAARTSKSVLQSGLKVGMAAAGATSAQELFIHSQQETRTLGESAANIATASLLSSVLGAGGHALFAKSPEYPNIVKRLEKELEYDEWADSIKASTEESLGQSVGAAAVKKIPREQLLEDNTLVKSGAIEGISATSPNLSLSTSPAVSSRLAVQELSDIKFWRFKKNLKGKLEATDSVESQVKRDMGRPLGASRFHAENWGGYRKRMGKDPNRLLREDFDTEIVRALNNKGKHEIPEIARAAQKYREDVYSHYGERAVEIGMFKDKDSFLENMDSYVPQIWDRAKVQRDSSQVQNELIRFFKEEYSKSQKGAKARIYEDAIETLDNSYFEDLAYRTWKNIIGAQSNALQDNLVVSATPKFAKGKKLTIPRERIEQWLVNDPQVLAKQYSSFMSTRLRLGEKFGLDFLTDNSKAAKSFVVQNIKDEYAKLQKKVIDKPKELKKLIAAEEKDLENLFALRDRLMGTYGYTANPDSAAYRFQKQVKQFNVATKLGDVVMSSTSDVGRAVSVGGYSKFLSKQLIPMARVMMSKEGRAYAKKWRSELIGMNVGADISSNQRFNSLADVLDDFGRHTKLERGLNAVGARFGQMSGMSYWNGWWKQTVGNGVMHNINDALNAFTKGKATKKQLTNLSRSGFDEASIKGIHAQLKKHGENYKGVLIPNIADWDVGTKDLAELYYGAIRSDVDATIVTPGIGTSPKWMSRNGLTLMGQFKSFSMASMEKTLIPMVQNFDASQVQGLSALVMTGAMTYMYKQWAAGKEIPTDPVLLVQQGVDRSGVLGWMQDIHNTIERGSGGEYGLSRILGTNKLQKFYNSSRAEAIFNALGPTAGLAQDVVEVGAGITGVNQKTVHAFRKMLPLQNMIGVRQTLDLMEEEFNNNLGIPKN